MPSRRRSLPGSQAPAGALSRAAHRDGDIARSHGVRRMIAAEELDGLRVDDPEGLRDPG
jgi:hypothetical protein